MTYQGLMLHTGGVSVTPETLETIPVPTREQVNAGARWRPIAHRDIRRLALDNARLHGWTVAGEAWGVLGEFQEDVYGALQLQRDDVQLEAPGGMAYALAIRSSNRQRFALTVSCGARVFVCDNGMITGEYILSRKHTVGLHATLESTIREGLWEPLKTGHHVVQAGASAFVNFGLDGPAGQARADHLLCELGREGVLPWSWVGKVDREYRSPRHPEFRERNAWSLYQCLTEIAKERSLPQQVQALRDGQAVIMKEIEYSLN